MLPLQRNPPMALETKFRVSDCPIQASPTLLTNARAPTKHDEKASSKRTAVRNIASNFNKRKKVSITPTASMLFFLREQYIASYVSKQASSSKSARGLSTQNSTKIATNACWRSWRHDFVWGPFRILQEQLEVAPATIAVENKRLLLEDLMLSQKGEELLVLISSDHQLFKNKGGNVPFTTNFLESIAIDPKRPETFKKGIYFGVTMIVASNPSQRNLKDSNMTLDEVRNLCTKQYGGEIHLKMKNNFSHLFIKFHDILEYSKTLFFYTSSLIQRMTHLKRAMRNIKDISRLGGIAARMMDEYLGDKTAFIEVSNFYDSLILKADSEAKALEYRNAPISTKRMSSYLELANKHPPFVQFRKMINDDTMKAVDDLYGRFSEFTSPLLPQSTIARYADTFKTTV